MNDYLKKSCVRDVVAKVESEVIETLNDFSGWEFVEGKIKKVFNFKNYYETTAFVNAVVWIAHREDHHPDIAFGYKNCEITYSTHSIGGVSENDFICAAKINAIL